MEVERYSPHKHYKLMLEWLTAREHYLPPEDEMPTVGFVAHLEGKPVAMGFIRRVEGSYGQLDGLVSNPSFPGDLRSQAIDIVVENIINKAKLMNLKCLTATSLDKNTLERSIKHGFVKLPHTVIAVDLTAGAQILTERENCSKNNKFKGGY